MKTTLAAVLALGMISWAGSLSAQTEQPKNETHQNVRTVSGCLSRDGNEYKLTEKDGSTWEVKSDAIDFGKHVGHTIEVTGAVDNAAIHGAKEDAKGAVDKDAKEHGHMTATKLKMESSSCK